MEATCEILYKLVGFGDALLVYTRGIFSLKFVYTTVWRSCCSSHPTIVSFENLCLHGHRATVLCSTLWSNNANSLLPS